MQGWFKFHRETFGHWIFEDAEYFRAWIYILGNAAFEETKQKVGTHLVTVNRGELLIGEERICNVFGWSRSKLRRFIELLIADNMLTKRIVRKKTKYIIVGYSKYQDTETEKEQKKDRKRTEKDTTKEEVKNEKNITLLRKVIKEIPEVTEDFIPILEKWLEYKQAKKQEYKNESSLSAFCKKLVNLSSGNSVTATKIVEESLANNWSGVFPLKEQSNVTPLRQEQEYSGGFLDYAK